MKRIVHIIPGMGIHCGGPSRSVLNLVGGLREIGIDAIVLTNDDPGDPLISTESWIDAVPYKRNGLGYNLAFKKELMEVDATLFHIHSVYSYSSTIAMWVAQKRQIPFIVSPRGSLLGSALSQSSKIKKSIFNKFVLIPDLNRAVAVHATSKEEVNDLVSLGVMRPTILISNSIKLPRLIPLIKEPVFRVGVCGRINPIKNIDGIIRAWKSSGLDQERAELVIIGGTRLEKESSYLGELHYLEQELKIPNIIWTGPRYGHEQQRIFQSLSVLLLGSHSENFGMVVPEALAMGIPVIASRGTPWGELTETNSGWWIDNSEESISETLKDVYNLFLCDKEALYRMGNNGRRLVSENYSQEAVAKKWSDAYEWLLSGADKPSFISIP